MTDNKKAAPGQEAATTTQAVDTAKPIASTGSVQALKPQGGLVNFNPTVGVVRRVTDLEPTPAKLSDLIENIRFGVLKEKIEAIRAEPNKDARRILKKNTLPAFMVSCHSDTRAGATPYEERGIVASNMVQVDLDGFSTVEERAACRGKLEAMPEVVCVFQSPSGDLKALVRAEGAGELGQHDRAWLTVAAKVKRVTGHELDESTCDVCRLCYLSHDPDIFVNPNPVVLPIGNYTAPAQKVSASYKEKELTPEERVRIISAVCAVYSQDDLFDRAVWIEIGQQIQGSYPGQEGFDLWEEIGIEGSPEKNDPKDSRRVWNSFKDPKSNGNIQTLGTLLSKAREKGWTGPTAAEVFAGHVPEPPLSQPGDIWPELIPFGDSSIEPKPWPWDATPKVLSDMGRAIARTYDVPAAVAGAAVLGAASIALGKKASLQIKRDHKVFGNAFWMIVGGVNLGKTPVGKVALAPLKKWEDKQLEEFKHEYAQWKADDQFIKLEIDAVKHKVRRGAGKHSAEDRMSFQVQVRNLEQSRKDPPTEPRLVMEDFTGEALGRCMAENDGFMGVFSPEARNLLEIAKGKYSDKGDIHLWLKGHGGDHCRVDRQRGASYSIDSATIAAVIMVQPDALQKLGESDALRESGFLSRWLYIVPPENVSSSYPVESVDESITAKFERLLSAMLNITPGEIVLDNDALMTWKKWHDDTKCRASTEEAHRDTKFKGWLSKQPESIARLALLFSVVKQVSGETVVLTDEIRNAARLNECLESHARRAIGIMNVSAKASIAQRTWNWLAAHRRKLTVKPRDLQIAGVAGIESADEAKQVLNQLAEHGYVRKVEVNPTGTQKSIAYEIRGDV